MPRQDARRDRQRVDAGIEHTETAGLPYPLLTRMPAADILFPDDIDAADMAFGEPGARRSDAGGVARMPRGEDRRRGRSEEHTSELQSLMRISYAVFCLKKKNKIERQNKVYEHT